MTDFLILMRRLRRLVAFAGLHHTGMGFIVECCPTPAGLTVSVIDQHGTAVFELASDEVERIRRATRRRAEASMAAALEGEAGRGGE
jgi:hypothetical protein